MEDRLQPAPDENAVVIPESWRRRPYPRRGGHQVDAMARPVEADHSRPWSLSR
ncbi:hypothetical protein ACQP1W_21780 [Spirillospora sp. CA-255316]